MCYFHYSSLYSCRSFFAYYRFRFCYIKISSLPAPSTPKDNSKFEMLLVKIFRLKQIKYLELLQKKSNFVSLRKQPHVLLVSYKRFKKKKQVDKAYNGKCKIKTIQPDISIFKHILTYPDIFRPKQAYSGIIQTYLEPCLTLAYSKPWCMNTGIFESKYIFRILAYSEP